MKRQFKFTKKALDALVADTQAREVEYSDTDVAGLRIVVNRLSRKSWLLRFTMSGVKRAMKLGDYPAVDIAEARLKAIEARAAAARGVDPQAAEVKPVVVKVKTFAEFMEQDYLPHAKSLRSYRDLLGRWRIHLKPVFGDTPLADLRALDIQRFHDRKKVELCAASANRLLALLKRALNLAILWGVDGLEKNPVRGVRMHAENNQRQAYLAAGDDLQRFMAALEREPSRTAAQLIKFLLATGVRRTEALTARFSDMNLDDATWRLTHTKNGRSRMVYLNEVALGIVKEQRKLARHDWVFPAAGQKNARLGDPKKAYKRILLAAGLQDRGLVLHSLRHSYASLVSRDFPLQVTGQLLGHRAGSTEVTARYSHFQASQLREASAVVSSAISDALR